MSEQRWRIVDATGAVREVSVRAGHSALGGVGYFASLRDGDVAVFDSAPRDAVLRLALVRYLPAAEILAPGEPTRAEAVAAARREGAAAMRAECVVACMVIDAGCITSVAEVCADAIRALPLPGDATPEHATLPAPVCPAPTGAP